MAVTKDVLKRPNNPVHKEVYAPFRADKACITFDNEDDYNTVLKATTNDRFYVNINDFAPLVPRLKNLAPEEFDATKHTRTIMRTIGSLAGLSPDEDNRKTLGANHYRKKEVYIGRVVVGAFVTESTGETETFHVYDDRIDTEAPKWGLDINDAAVKTKFDEEMAK